MSEAVAESLGQSLALRLAILVCLSDVVLVAAPFQVDAIKCWNRAGAHQVATVVVTDTEAVLTAEWVP